MNENLTESQIIELSKKYFSAKSPNIIKGIGDDTAVLKLSEGYQLFTTDMLVENTHFLLEKITPYNLGWKSIAVSISDIASMGGIPNYAILSLGLNKNIDYIWLESFYQGMADCADTYYTFVVGGDTVLSKEAIVVNVALLGASERPVYRNNIKDGFILAITGEHGASAAGLWVLQNLKEEFSKEEKYCIDKHTRPIPRVKEASFLNLMITNLSMIDSSDSLYTSCKIFCEQSGVGLELYEEQFPVSDELKTISTKTGKTILELILYGGEDYELVVAMPEDEYQFVKEEYLKTFGVPLTCIGKFNSNSEINLNSGNTNIILQDKSFKHF